MTKKQRLFFKELLTSQSNSDAARKAGYSPTSAGVSAHKNITKYNEFYLTLFMEAGLDIPSLAKTLRTGLESEDQGLKFKYTKLALEMIDKVLQAECFNVVEKKAFEYTFDACSSLMKFNPDYKCQSKNHRHA